LDQAELQALKESFREVRFTPELEDSFFSYWREMHFEKGAWITEAGKTEPYFYYVLGGVQAIYAIDQRGEKVILGFSYRGDFSGAYQSFLTQTPSELFLEAMLPSRMLGIRYEDYEQLFRLSPDFDRWGRKFMEGIVIGRLQRELELITDSARDRYLQFMRRCPEELLQIPQKYLDSYLNMSPETFSRFRSSVRY
jgi:CRP-like cAMP-binding protein